MSSFIDTASLVGSIRAIQMGYTQKAEIDFDRIIHPPWTWRDLSDMYYISDKLNWLLNEIKSGYGLNVKEHGWTIQNIVALAHALTQKEREFHAKENFNPSQPRVPSGNSQGGRWTDGNGGGAGSPRPTGNGGGGRFGIGKIPKNPLFRAVVDSDHDGVEDTRPKNPMDPLGGPISPGRGNVGGLTATEAEILEAEQQFVVNTGREHGKQFLKRSSNERLTGHGNLRVNQRLPAQKEVDAAVESAIKTGKITRKIGQYGTYQYHYEGESGLKVIVETQGRNAGKVITTYWKGTKGELWWLRLRK